MKIVKIKGSPSVCGDTSIMADEMQNNTEDAKGNLGAQPADDTADKDPRISSVNERLSDVAMVWKEKYLRLVADLKKTKKHLPDLKIRVVNVVDLMKLQPQTENPHRLSDVDFDELFNWDMPEICNWKWEPAHLGGVLCARAKKSRDVVKLNSITPYGD